MKGRRHSVSVTISPQGGHTIRYAPGVNEGDSVHLAAERLRKALEKAQRADNKARGVKS